MAVPWMPDPQQLADAAAYMARSMEMPPIPQYWLRDEWSTSSFGPPYFVPEGPLDDQWVWATRKATIAIHTAFWSGDWAPVIPLTIALAMVDRVTQLNEYARRTGHTGLRLSADWMADRELDIANIYNQATAFLAPAPVQMPGFNDFNTLAMFALRCVYWQGKDAITDFPDIPGLDNLDGHVFGQYAPHPDDLRAERYEVISGSFDIARSDTAIAHAVRDMVAWEEEHGGADYTQRLANRPRPRLTMLPEGLRDRPNPVSVGFP